MIQVAIAQHLEGEKITFAEDLVLVSILFSVMRAQSYNFTLHAV